MSGKVIFVLMALVFLVAYVINTDVKADEEFCGWGDNKICLNNSDCKVSGCNKEVCGADYYYSACVWLECYNSDIYEMRCGCNEGKCGWIYIWEDTEEEEEEFEEYLEIDKDTAKELETEIIDLENDEEAEEEIREYDSKTIDEEDDVLNKDKDDEDTEFQN